MWKYFIKLEVLWKYHFDDFSITGCKNSSYKKQTEAQKFSTNISGDNGAWLHIHTIELSLSVACKVNIKIKYSFYTFAYVMNKSNFTQLFKGTGKQWKEK